MTNPVDLPQYAPAPTLPVIGSASFAPDVQNFFAWQTGAATGANVVGLAQSAATNAKSAQESAIAAQAASAGIDVPTWEPNENYHVGRGVKSPAAIAAGANPIYICKVAISGSTTDPYGDPAHWSIFTVSGGVGGAVYTTSTALTASSPFAIQISGGAGVWLKLPNATTLSTGIRHTVRNTGDNDLTLIDAAGAHIGFIRPQCGTTIALSDNSTAAGKWAGDWEVYGITANCSVLSSISNVNSIKSVLKIDFNRTLYLIGGDSGGGLYAFIFNRTTGIIGDAVLIRASCSFASSILTSENQCLCISSDAGTAMQAAVFSISGEIISGLTVASATLGYTCNNIGGIIKVGSAFVASLGSSSNGILRAITINSGVAAIGAEQSMSSSEPPRLFATGNTLRTVYSTGTSIYFKPFTISGNTLNSGNQASVSSVSAATDYRTIMFDNGNIFAMHYQSGACIASVSRLSGVTESITNTTLFSTGSGWQNPDLKYFDFEIISSGKVFVVGSSFESGSPLSMTIFCNIFNDTGSTQSAGVAWSNYIGTLVGTSANVFGIKSSGFFGIGLYGYYSSNHHAAFFSFDTSGVSPILLKKSASQFTSGYIPPIIPDKKDIFGRLNGASCRIKSGIASIGHVNSSSGYSAIKYTLSGWSAMAKMAAANIAPPSLRGASDYVSHGITRGGVTGGVTVFTIETTME